MTRRNPLTARPIQIREWSTTELELSAEELLELQRSGAELLVQPLGAGRYAVQPSSVIGSVRTPRLRILIEPKFRVDRLFHLLGRTHRVHFLRSTTELGDRTGLTDGFAAIFLNMVQRQMRRGLLKGYRTEHEALPGIRGRVRTADQLRRRFAMALPVEVTYDDYTEDITENRLLKAALRRLTQLRPASPHLRSRLAEALASFAVVSDIAFNRSNLPTIRYSRLSEPYRPVLELAILILRNSAVELQQGRRAVAGLLFDMNQVFEDFVFESLRRRLVTSFGPRDSWRQGLALPLDDAGVLRPQPDLAWRRGKRCLFVGDAKYKATAEGRLSDIYQLLAYCTAANVDEGLLVYAEQPGGPATHRIVNHGPRLRVEAIDLESSVEGIERRCDQLARRIVAIATSPNQSTPTAAR